MLLICAFCKTESSNIIAKKQLHCKKTENLYQNMTTNLQKDELLIEILVMKKIFYNIKSLKCEIIEKLKVMTSLNIREVISSIIQCHNFIYFLLWLNLLTSFLLFLQFYIFCFCKITFDPLKATGSSQTVEIRLKGGYSSSKL